MESVGQLIRRLRLKKGEPLRTVAAFLDIDPAVLSKIETGHRRVTRKQVERLAGYFGAEKKEMLVAWLSDRIVSEIGGESYTREALKVAEEKLHYSDISQVTLSKIQKAVNKELKKYPQVSKAWIFGSYARDEKNYLSDIDLIIDVPGKKDFSLFDLFQIQHDLENFLGKKVDIVIKGALKPVAWQTAQNDLKLIYARKDI